MSKPFHFKKFAVCQEECAMKVGTDGVLLGAWAKIPFAVQSILDIGTGSGVIALMLAQRFVEAKVVGIDIDEGACKQAEENFQNSPFAERLTVIHSALQNFQVEQKFDCIVSNPPFFSAGILPSNEQRELARHTTQFSFEMFFEKVAELLSDKGLLSIIVPINQAEKLLSLAEKSALYCHNYCTVFPNPNKESKRVLLTFGKYNTHCAKSELTIETSQSNTPSVPTFIAHSSI
ncbi:MAG: methyltransferase, partial [Flavobacteriaceae bacterium]|nr:methyltransferase [Flavobacteriaceae bacterium]